ncbi:MAG: acetyl-CoA C-acyltransferase [Myxococcales bacterium]|nr:acetyl-CoA C-acyltransferase [Myxococcales bacterium]
MSAVFVVEAMRSPIGRYGGGLSRVRPDDLAAQVLNRTWQCLNQPADVIDEVILGCANQAGEDNRNIARMATLLAGFPQKVPAITVNRLCASGLDAINAGFRRIALGEADVVLTGGVESMSRAPWVMGKPYTDPPRGNTTMFDTALGWRFPNPALEAIFPLEAMGITAERLVDDYNISREAQDAFAFQSQQRALAAQQAGRFDRELLPITVQLRKTQLVVDRDEGPRSDSTLEKLARLRAVFRKGGSVTAGNSSTLNDGAAVLVLASESAITRFGWTPLARVVGVAQAGVDPTRMGIGPVPATEVLLERVQWTLSQVDLIELNEAFAAQSLAVLANWDIDPERVNPNGGAIALGHPLGCSGARIATTLIHEMQRRQVKRGVATLCVGVGQGVATAFERI